MIIRLADDRPHSWSNRPPPRWAAVLLAGFDPEQVFSIIHHTREFFLRWIFAVLLLDACGGQARRDEEFEKCRVIVATDGLQECLVDRYDWDADSARSRELQQVLRDEQAADSVARDSGRP
jgi:hypothetical protein